MPHPERPLAPATRELRLVPILLGAILLATAVGSLVAPGAEARSRTPSRADQDRFMWALASQESGHDYYARNRSSGAFGKYQIMPFNWPAWSLKYLGHTKADQTPWNQERVAYGKLRDLHHWLGSWRRVAYWWLTGRSERNERRWSSYAKGYVDNIMGLKKRAPRDGATMPPRTSSLATRGDWRRSGGGQKLHLDPAGRPWPKRGSLREGQVLKVRTAKTVRGARWLRVVTADGRLGWVGQPRTLPARQPKAKRRWSDVDDRGKELGRRGRSMVRPRPR